MYGLEPTSLIIVSVVIIVLFSPALLRAVWRRLRARLLAGLDEGADDYLRAQTRRLAGGGSCPDWLFVLYVADLCHPNFLSRTVAATTLSRLLPEEADHLRRCADRPVAGAGV